MGMIKRIARRVFGMNEGEYFQSLLCAILRETGNVKIPKEKISCRALSESNDFYIIEIVDGFATLSVYPKASKAVVEEIKDRINY